MAEILNWILWSIGFVAVGVALFVGVAWVIFWVTDTITESRRQQTYIAERVGQCHRWFSGFKDLDIIWDYIYGKRDNISDTRDAYARFRGTDVYGKRKEDPFS